MGVRASEMPIPLPEDATAFAGATIRVPTNRRARRRMFRRLACAVPGLAPICCDSNDLDTVEKGFWKRLFRRVPTPDPVFLAKFRRFVQDYLQAHVPCARQLSFEEWLETTSYNEARKSELRHAHDELKGGRPTKRQASHIDTFVKSESYTEYKWCRMINSRSDAFKVFSGPLFKAIEEVVYGMPEFIKHVPVVDRPRMVRSLRRAGRHYYQTDFTAYESHFTSQFMDSCECLLYRHCLSWSRDVDFLCTSLTGANRMRTRTGVFATVNGRRMSGDMCTSLGNGFTNLMLAKFLAREQGHELYGFVEGDDGLFATEANLLATDYARLGFTIKIDEVVDPCAASFCGMVFAESGEIVRNPVDFLAAFGWTSSFISGGEKLMLELLRAKALSAVYETPQCPIVGAIARRALFITRHVDPRFVDDGYHRPPPSEFHLPEFQPSDDTRELVHQLYGISPSLQRDIESRLLAGDYDVAAMLPVRSGDNMPRSAATDPYYHYSARFIEVG